jgi:hypothetical protein
MALNPTRAFPTVFPAGNQVSFSQLFVYDPAYSRPILSFPKGCVQIAGGESLKRFQRVALSCEYSQFVQPVPQDLRIEMHKL